MSSAAFRLVLLVSCSHALVHVFEQSLPSVEQLIGVEFEVSREVTGPLGTAWRIPFGAGAFLAGWLADRFGPRRLLLAYLLGCASCSISLYWATELAAVFTVMFAMGSFASIYHPAGLAVISHESDAENLGRALGWHGIFGSVGIASAPLLAAAFFALTPLGWRSYYLLLAVAGIAAAAGLAAALPNRVYRLHPVDHGSETRLAGDERTHWTAYLLLVAIGTIFGFIYAAFTHFLPRYLDDVGLRPSNFDAAGFRTLLSGIVLICGAAGQAMAGRLARPRRLRTLFVCILFANAPCLLWMAFAEGQARLWATAATAFFHFMNQPVYNSLIAEFVPRRHRSTGYGFSNMMCFGLGALGPTFAGIAGSDLAVYGTLAVLAAISGGMAIALANMKRLVVAS